MPDQNAYYRERASRSRSRRSTAPEGDTMNLVLTAQVAAVLLLLLAVWILKSADRAGYDSFKERSRAMSTDPSSFSGEVLRALGDAWKRAEQIAHGLLPVPKQGQTAPESSGEISAPPSAEREEDLDEPELPAYRFHYDYISPEKPPELTGQGGANPVAIANVNIKTAYAPPAGSVLSPAAISAPLIPPVTGPVTSAFAWRYHPITDTADFHTGIDIAAEEGRAVLAALPGEVIEVGYSQVYGNYIVLSHATSLRTSYSHCSEIIAREGMAVRQGERIAKVGQSGTATGPHLHFSVIVDGVYTNPYWALSDFIVVE